MVRGSVTTVRAAIRLGWLALVSTSALSLHGCGRDREMAESAEMPDSMEVRRALEDPTSRDVMLDTMPGGEMVRGDSAIERHLLEDKMP